MPRRIVEAMPIDAHEVLRALRGGVATLDALAARTGAARDELLWALDEAAARGWVASAGGEDCGPDGVCGSAPPAMWRLTDAGRAALSARV